MLMSHCNLFKSQNNPILNIPYLPDDPVIRPRIRLTGGNIPGTIRKTKAGIINLQAAIIFTWHQETRGLHNTCKNIYVNNIRLQN